jgi:4a-hydroxytetrahydrobiopterin dehydratase
MTEEGEPYRKLSDGEIRENLEGLKDWKLVSGKLHREMTFESFEDAVSFMMRSSMEIAKLDHHPEWFNVYNRVTVDLVTHDVGGLSQYDFELARKLDDVARTFGPKK